MGRDRAAYMREYRARKDAARIIFNVGTDDAKEVLRLRDRVKELEEEVRHLKAELAKRPRTSTEAVFELADEVERAKRPTAPFVEPYGPRVVAPPPERFNTRPFTPVPKVKK